MFGIHYCNDTVEAVGLLDIFVHEKSLSHRTRVSQTCCLDHDIVKLIPALHEITQDAQQIATHRAADAAVIHLENLFVRLDNQLVVHPHFSEFVFDNSDPLSVVFG